MRAVTRAPTVRLGFDSQTTRWLNSFDFCSETPVFPSHKHALFKNLLFSVTNNLILFAFQIKTKEEENQKLKDEIQVCYVKRFCEILYLYSHPHPLLSRFLCEDKAMNRSR